tara:strand:+ start:845 stop:1150 length:306 start_codon:yes stop_codon:yes gene_type:complete
LDFNSAKTRRIIKSLENAAPSPTGWLISPTSGFILFFRRDLKSPINFPNKITQLWYCTSRGTPTRLKHTRRMDLESAIETWNELITNGWELVEHQINEETA